MPNQQTPAQARTIDPILSSVVRGFKHPQNVLTEALFPFVPVAKEGGTRIEFDKTDFRQVETRRAPGSRVAEVQFGHTGKAYALVAHALAGKVPVEHIREAAGTPAADKMGRAALSVMSIMLLNLEREQAALATTAANYDASNKVTLTGANQWNDPTADILGQVGDWKAAVRADIGMEPNTLVLPYGAKKAISKNAQILEAIKYTQFGVGRIALLSSFFEIERVFIAAAVTSATGATFSDVWGDFGLLAFVEPNPSDAGMPSYGYTYQLEGHPSASETWFDRDTKSWKTDVEHTRSAEIVGADSGYLVTDLVG